MKQVSSRELNRFVAKKDMAINRSPPSVSSLVRDDVFEGKTRARSSFLGFEIFTGEIFRISRISNGEEGKRFELFGGEVERCGDLVNGIACHLVNDQAHRCRLEGKVGN